MNLDGYNTKLKQTLMSLLVQAEAEGVNDIRFLRKRLQLNIDSDFKSGRVSMSKERKKQALAMQKEGKKLDPLDYKKSCPSCGSKQWFQLTEEDNIIYYGCRDCRYSKGEINE